MGLGHLLTRSGLTYPEVFSKVNHYSIYYTTDIVSLLHVSATYCGHLQGGVPRRVHYKEHQNRFTNTRY